MWLVPLYQEKREHLSAYPRRWINRFHWPTAPTVPNFLTICAYTRSRRANLVPKVNCPRPRLRITQTNFESHGTKDKGELNSTLALYVITNVLRRFFGTGGASLNRSVIKKDGGNNGRALFLCKFIRFAPTDFAINFRDFFFFNDTMDTMDIPFDDLISIQRAICCLQFLLAVRKYLYR